MSKRLVSFLLIFTLVFSAIPIYVSAATEAVEDGTEANPYIIDSAQEFEEFLGSATKESATYYLLNADIKASEGAVITGKDAKNVLLDGNGHTVSGYTLNGALFSSMVNSAVRNIVFSDIKATPVSGEASVAVISKSVDGNSYVTNCKFENCTIDAGNVADGLKAAFVTDDNNGVITSCVVENTCKVLLDTDAIADDIYVGGIAAYSKYYIYSSISRADFSGVKAKTADGYYALFLGGIAGYNHKADYIEGCFAEVTAPSADNNATFGYFSAYGKTKVKNSYYIADGKIYSTDNKEYADDVYMLAAELSTVAQNISNKSGVLKADYAKLYGVKNNQLFLSQDGKEAWVTITIGKDLVPVDINSSGDVYNDSDIAKVAVTATDENAKVIYTDDTNTAVSKVVTPVGYYDENNNYVRNNLKIKVVCANMFYVVDSFTYKFDCNYFRNCVNVFDENAGNYPLTNYVKSTCDSSGSVAEIQIYPGNATLGISSNTQKDQIVPYQFSGSGTDAAPYEISNEYELDVMRHYINNNPYPDKKYSEASYKLTEDITLSSNKAFAPIGAYTSSKTGVFKGKFDGGFHVINGLVITNDNAYQGFFGYVNGTADKPAVIKNLFIISGKIQQNSDGAMGQRGILASTAVNAEISGCIVSGSVVGSTQLGGIAGYISNSTIKNCAADVTVTPNYNHAWAGGAVGFVQDSLVYNSYFLSDIDVKSVVKEEYLSIGGVSGSIENSVIEDCYYSTAVSVYNSDSKAKEVAIKKLTVTDGMIPTDKNTLISSETLLASLMFNAAESKSDQQWVKGTENFFDKMPVVCSNADSSHLVVPVSSSMGDISVNSTIVKAGESVTATLSGDIEKISVTDINKNEIDVEITYSNGTATFTMPQTSVRLVPVYEGVYFTGRGTETDPFVISSYEELVLMAEKVSSNETYKIYTVTNGSIAETDMNFSEAYYVLGADINGSADGSEYKDFWSVGEFKGVLDGQGYKISYLKIGYDTSKSTSCGFFVSLDDATLKNITFDNIKVTAQNTKDTYGGVLAPKFMDNCKIKNVTISNCLVENVSNGGCLFGMNDNGNSAYSNEVINCLLKNNTFSGCSSVGWYVGATFTKNSKVLLANNCIVVGNSSVKASGAHDGGTMNVGMISTNNVQYFSAVTDISGSVVADYSYRAEGIDDAVLWGQVADTKDVYLATGELKSLSRIDYDSCFGDSSQLELLDLENAPAIALEGEKITIKRYDNTSLVDFRILSRNENVSYIAEEDTDDDGWGTISFTMPYGSVKIDNADADMVMAIPGEGTENAPYEISSRNELMWLSKVIRKEVLQYKWYDERYVPYENAHFIVTKDIDMTNVEWSGIGTDVYYFNGTFDGGYHTISNLNKGNTFDGLPDWESLFCILGEDAVVKNVYLENASVHVEDTDFIYTGIIARENYGTISRCMIYDSFVHQSVGTKSYVGGIVGKNHSGASVEVCGILNTKYTSAAGIPTTTPLAGMVGINDGDMFACYTYNATVSGGTDYNHGVTTGGSGKVRYCYHDVVFGSYDGNVETNPFIFKTINFNNGALADIVNEAYGDDIDYWFQNLDNGLPVDEAPVPLSNSINTVYYVDVGKYTNMEVSSITVSPESVALRIGNTATLNAVVEPVIKDNTGVTWSSSDTNVATVDANGVVTAVSFGEATITAVPEYNKNLSATARVTVGLEPNDDGVFVIHNYEELYGMAQLVNSGIERYVTGDYILANDIDVENRYIEPIGNPDQSANFKGTFDGCGHTISNYKILLPGHMIVSSLFGRITGTVKNLKLAGDFTVYSEVNDRAVICSSAFAYILASTAQVYNIQTNVNYKLENTTKVEEIVGLARQVDTGAKVERCLVNDTVNLPDVSLYHYSGLFDFAGDNFVLKNCGNISTVNVKECESGAVGLIFGSPFDTYSFENCYVACKISCGGLLPTVANLPQLSASTTNCYVLDSVVAEDYNSPYSENLVSIDKFKSGEVAYLLNGGVSDGTQIWYQNLDNGYTPDDYPQLDSNNINDVYKVERADRNYSNININNEGVYEISNAAELVAFSHWVNSGHYDADAIVINDIDMSGVTGFTPIGQTGLYFSADPAADGNWGYKGDFNGNGHVIKNLSLTGSSSEDLSYGLFGTLSGTVRAVGMKNFTYTGGGKDCRVGAIAGQVITGGKITDCYLQGGSINTQINTTNGVAGGIAGANYAGEVKNCYVYALVVSAGRAGGIVGDNYGDANNSDGSDRPGTITNCYTDYGNICNRGAYSGGFGNVPLRMFNSGEITFCLGGGGEDALWLQGTNNMPDFTGSAIYQNTCEGDIFYSTYNKSFEHHDIVGVRCSICHNFDAATMVTDSNYDSLGLTVDYKGLYAIENASNMYWFSERDSFDNLTGGMVLLTDIAIDSGIEPWNPINVDSNFIFDGRFNTITLNLDYGKVNRESAIGLFNDYNYAIVKNLVLDGSITANTTGYMGALAGSMYRSTVSKVISYVDVTNICTESGYTGGISGYFGGKHSGGLYSLIENTAVYADVSGYHAGGLVGHGWNGTQYYDIKNSVYVGNVTGTAYQGAIIGYHGNKTNVTNCTFKDVYFNEADDLGFVGGGGENYTLDSTVGNRSLEQFASGEITYILNHEVSDGTQCWFQNIDNGEPKDAYPLLMGATVYRNQRCTGEFVEFSNTKDAYVHNYNNYHVCKDCVSLEPGEIAGIWGFTISLGGNIAVNYYMVLDDKVLEDENAKMVFTVPDTGSVYTQEIPVSDAEINGKFHIFTCEVAAKEITSDILCKIVTETDESDTFTYSVKEYADVILANADVYSTAVALVKTMLNYGANAQVYFNHNLDKLANDSDYITEEEKLLPEELDLSSFEMSVEGEEEGIFYYGSSLSLKSETSINHYFYAENDEIAETITITVDGEPFKAYKNGDLYVIKISDIPAHMIQTMYETKVGNITLNYGAYSYGHLAMQGTNEKLKNTIRALYLYNQAAMEYIGE